MALQALDQAVYEVDRVGEIEVYINGTLLTSGVSQGGDAEVNVLGVDVQYDVEAMPPTCSISVVDIPEWVNRGMDVWIDAGFDGNMERIFTGAVKRRRHAPDADTIDCVGRTAVITRPFRSSDLPKSWTAQLATDAIEDILDDLTPPFVPFDIVAILQSDGAAWSIGTPETSFLESMSASDMIRKIADVYGHRAFETKSGMLRIRPLLEAPAPTGFRTYGTRGGDRLVDATEAYSDANIDATLNLGDVAANTERAQGFQLAAAGSTIRVSFWMQRVGSPIDFIRLRIEDDNGSGLPNGTVLAGGRDYLGATLLVGTYTRVDVVIETNTTLQASTTYHLIVERSTAVDAVNYYQVGTDDTAPGYANGAASVRDGAGVWTVTDAGGDGANHAFEVVSTAFPTLRLIGITDDEDEDQVKKEAIVRGRSLPGTDTEGNEIQTLITATRFTDSDELLAGNRHLYSMTYQNELIQTVLVADDVAQRLVDKYHRILQSIEIEVPFDPRIDLGATIIIDDPDTAADPGVTGLTGNWWVRGYRHSLAAGQAVTQISLFGGDQSGTATQSDPRPDFHWLIERELVGNALQAIVTFYDDSTDLDGWIVNYRWRDDYAGGANDQQGRDLRVVTFAYDPNVDTVVNMTLTVTDNEGNTASITKAVDVSTDNDEAYAPVVSCAGGNTCMLTIDGGLSWNDVATPSGLARVTEVTQTYDLDANMVVLFGTDTGRIYRSTDNNATLTEVAGVALTDGFRITAIEADRILRQRIWATTTEGHVLVSFDFGATWNLFHHLGLGWPHRHDSPGDTSGNDEFHVDPRPVNGILLSEPSVNRIWVFGGRGTDPESWFHTHYLPDENSKWHAEVADTIHGDAEADSTASTTGSAAHTVVDTVVSHRTSGDLGLLFDGRNPPYMYASRFYPAESAAWRNGTGLAATDGIGVAGNNNRLGLFGLVLGDRDFYRSGDGLGWWRIPTVLPGTGANEPNHLIQVSAWKDIYLAATDEGITKSVDYGATWAFFRPQGAPINTIWPAGAIGHQVAIEYRRPRRFDLMAIVETDPAEGALEMALATLAAGTWTDRGPLPTAFIDRPHRLYHWAQIDPSTAFFIRYISATTGHVEDLYRSSDLGVNWSIVLNRAGDLARGPDGTMWATWEPDVGGHGVGIDERQHDIRFSSDNGATWTTSFTNANTSDSFWNIAVDPNDPNRVMVIGNLLANDVVLAVSTDATLGASASWSRIATPTGLPSMDGTAPRYHNPKIVAGENGRWICAYQTNAIVDLAIYTSDNNGTTWTRRHLLQPAGSTFGFAHLLRMGHRLVACGNMILDSAIPVLFSDDNGDTWQVGNNIDAMRAYVYDARINALFGAREAASDQIQYMQPPVGADFGSPGTAWTGGLAVGLRVAMGYTNEPTIPAEGLARAEPAASIRQYLLWAIMERSETTSTGSVAQRDGAGDWREVDGITPDIQTAQERFAIWHFEGMGDIMFRLKIEDLGNVLFGYGGALERSTDRGVTWATVLSNAGSLTRGADGRLWATADDRVAPAHFQPRSIYRSTDNGATWGSPIATDTSAGAGGSMTQYQQIAVDPSDNNHVMVIGVRHLNTFRFGVTTDGSAFTFTNTGLDFRGGDSTVGKSCHLLTGTGGRWIASIARNNGLRKRVYTSDDDGSNWVLRLDYTTTNIQYGFADGVVAGTNIYFGGTNNSVANGPDNRVHVSSDNGTTWTPFGAAADQTEIVAMTWDSNQNVLFIGRNVAGDEVMEMRNPGPSGVWVGIGATAADLGWGAGDPRVKIEGLKVVP